MQSCLQRSTGRGPRSQKVECFCHQKYSALRWAAVWATLVQFEMVCMRSEKQKIQLTPWEPSSISFIHWVPGFPVTFIPPKVMFGNVFYKTWSTSRWRSSRLIQTCQCCFMSSSSCFIPWMPTIMLMIILALYVVFGKSTFQLWSQVLKIKLLNCLKNKKQNKN